MNKNASKNYFKPSVSVDVVVFTIEKGDLQVLTIDRANSPFKGVAALPGGFLRPEETTLEAAKRVLAGKVGLKDMYLEQLYTFDDPKRDPRGPVLSVSYFALAPRHELHIETSPQTEHPKFTSVKKLPKLAFDHEKIVHYAEDRMRTKLEYSNIALSLLPNLFTFTELQKIYEIILARKLDKRNFRKKIARLEIIKATTQKIKNGRQRPALLYKPASGKTRLFKNSF